MYILSNALTSISRNKGRNIMIAVIVLLIAAATTITLAINNAADHLITAYAEKYDTEATISFNRENMMKDFQPGSRDESMEQMSDLFSAATSLSIEDVENYADSDYVKEYYYTISLNVDSDDLEAASVSTPDGRGAMGGAANGNFGGPDNNNNAADFTLTGYSSLAAMTEFIEGSYSITEGAVSEDFTDNSCLINSELATLNEISVGDTILLFDPNDSSVSYSFVVSGIFEENSADNGMSMFAGSANTIITNANAVATFAASSDSLSPSLNPTFVLVSSDVVDAYEAELRAKGLSENLSLETNLDQVASATSTISNVRNFALTFLIVTLIIGTVVLFVLNLINIRERKYEIGVLRTIGMKKSLVSLQFMFELLIVSFVALLLGAGLGACLSVPVSNSLLASEIKASQSTNQAIGDRFGFAGGDANGGNSSNAPASAPDQNQNGHNFKGVATVQAYDSIDAAVDLKVLAELLSIGLLITLISSIGATVSVQRFSPLTILKERS